MYVRTAGALIARMHRTQTKPRALRCDADADTRRLIIVVVYGRKIGYQNKRTHASRRLLLLLRSFARPQHARNSIPHNWSARTRECAHPRRRCRRHCFAAAAAAAAAQVAYLGVLAIK